MTVYSRLSGPVDHPAVVAHDTVSRTGADARLVLNKVPEITVWFWVVKILCTTVGESFADYVDMTLGVGLTRTAVLFTVVFAVVLAVQLSRRRYVPVVYWLTVVVVSITGTLYTDILTDSRGVALRTSTTVFAVVLAAVFGLWYARERTLSIHSIVTLPRELFYWLAVLVTFALGTAAGDWTLDLTGWGPGISVLLPAALIAVVTLGWSAGGQPVLAFWLAYVLTRPLGANIGDWFATPSDEKGLGLGTAVTSVVFLVAITATVLYLTLSRADVATSLQPGRPADPARQKGALVLYVVSAALAGLLLHHQSQQPHAALASEGEGGGGGSSVQLTPVQATARFPAADVAALRTSVQRVDASVTAGDQEATGTAATGLETLWDDDQSRLEALDATAWTFLDGQIDDVLSAVRAKHPDAQTEQEAVDALGTSLGAAAVR